jgi:hypothetical protein
MLSERSRPQQVGDVVPTVAAPLSGRPSGSPACPLWVGIATGGPISGWPPVQLPPTPVAPGGQPVPCPAQRCPAEALPVPPPRLTHPGRRSSGGIPMPVPGGHLGSQQAAPVARPRWGCCPADRLLHLLPLDPTAVREALTGGWAQARCGRLIFAADLTLRGTSAGVVPGLPGRRERAMSSTTRAPGARPMLLASSPPARFRLAGRWSSGATPRQFLVAGQPLPRSAPDERAEHNPAPVPRKEANHDPHRRRDRERLP